VCNQGIILM